jgi:hypothetical protein
LSLRMFYSENRFPLFRNMRPPASPVRVKSPLTSTAFLI